jgi:hypothetical protein
MNGYVEVGLGRDNNVGSATDLASLNLPAAGLYVPAPPMGLKTDDGYATVGAGGEINHQLTDQWGLYVGGDIRGRSYQTHADAGSSSLE